MTKSRAIDIKEKIWLQETSLSNEKPSLINHKLFLNKAKFIQCFETSIKEAFVENGITPIEFTFEKVMELFYKVIQNKLPSTFKECSRSFSFKQVLTRKLLEQLRIQVETDMEEYPVLKQLTLLFDYLANAHLRSLSVEELDMEQILEEYRNSSNLVKYIMLLVFTEISIIYGYHSFARLFLWLIVDNDLLCYLDVEDIGLLTWELELRSIVSLPPSVKILEAFRYFVNEFGVETEETNIIIESLVMIAYRLKNLDYLRAFMKSSSQEHREKFIPIMLLCLIKYVPIDVSFVSQIINELKDLFARDQSLFYYLYRVLSTILAEVQNPFHEEINHDKIMDVIGLLTNFPIEEQLFLRALIVSILGDLGYLFYVRDLKSELIRLFLVISNFEVFSSETHIWWERTSSLGKETLQKRRHMVLGLIPEATILSEGRNINEETIRTVEEMSFWMPRDLKIRVLKRSLPQKILIHKFEEVNTELKSLLQEGVFYRGGIHFSKIDTMEILLRVIEAFAKLEDINEEEECIQELLSTSIELFAKNNEDNSLSRKSQNYLDLYQAIINGLRGTSDKFKLLVTILSFEDLVHS